MQGGSCAAPPLRSATLPAETGPRPARDSAVQAVQEGRATDSTCLLQVHGTSRTCWGFFFNPARKGWVTILVPSIPVPSTHTHAQNCCAFLNSAQACQPSCISEIDLDTETRHHVQCLLWRNHQLFRFKPTSFGTLEKSCKNLQVPDTRALTQRLTLKKESGKGRKLKESGNEMTLFHEYR